jgi:hypothetical protein
MYITTTYLAAGGGITMLKHSFRVSERIRVITSDTEYRSF